MKKQMKKIALSLVITLFLTVLSPIFNIPSSAESLNSLYIGDFIDNMILDEARGYIYTTIGEDSRLVFISLDNMQMEKEIPLSSYAYDAKMYNGKLYLALSNESKIIAINLETKEIESTYSTTNEPENFVIDGNRIFFVTGEQSTYLYEYNLDTGEEKTLIVGNDTTYTTYANPDLAIDRENNVLYIGESTSSGSDIDAMSTIDYSRLHNSTYDEGYGFPYAYRNVILDGQDIFYAGRKLDKNNLSTIYGMYMSDGIENYKNDENIVFVRDNYVITDQYIYDRNTFIRLAKTPCYSKRILMDSSYNIYIYNSDTMSLEKKSLDLDLENDDTDYNLANVLFMDNTQLHDWIYDDINDKIYALSDNSNKLLFINGNDLIIENELNIGSLPSDIEIYDNKIYISLFGATKIVVVDISTRQIEGYIDLKHNPYKIAIDSNKIFYVEEDQHLYLYEYDLNTETEKEITVQGDTYTNYYEADLAVDRLNHILYIGESGSSGSDLEAISTIDYSRVDKSNIDFEYPERNIILDGDSIFYGNFQINKNNLSEISGEYKDLELTHQEDIIYTKGNYVFTKKAVYDKNTFEKLFDLGSTNSPNLIIVDSNNTLYIYYEGDTVHRVFKFDFVNQRNLDYPRNFTANFNTNDELELRWEPVDEAEEYNIYYELASEPSRPIQLTSVPASDMVYKTVYFEDSWYDNMVYFGATAIINGDESTISYMDSKFFDSNPNPKVEAPQNFIVNYDNISEIVNFNWDSVDNADAYNLYYKLNTSAQFTKFNTVTNTVYEMVYMDDWYDKTIDFGVSTIIDNMESLLTTTNYSFNTSEIENPNDNDGRDSNSDDNDKEDSNSDKNDIIHDGNVNINEEEIIKDSDGNVTVEIDKEGIDDTIDNLEDSINDIKIDVKEEAENIIIKLPGESYQKLNRKGKGKKITINSPNGKYILPVDNINISDIITESGEATVEIEIKNINDEDITQKLENYNLETIGQPVEFSVRIVTEDEIKEIKSFGSQYVERWIPLNTEFDKDTTVGIMYDKKTGELIPVPTTFYKDDQGKNWAVLKRNGNSIYSVVRSKKEFKDTQNHWAEQDIELMASKLIVRGLTESDFAPDQNITRAEYVVLLTRALGLKYEDKETEISFSDVKKDDWYHDAIQTTSGLGLVNGYGNKTFKPNNFITREEMAVITMRAFEFVEAEKVADLNYLYKFSDSDKVKSWAQDSVAKTAELGLMNGKAKNLFDPDTNTTRAESVVVLKSLLEKLNFIEF